MTTEIIRRAYPLVMAILFVANLQTRAVQRYVGVDDSGFLPATLNINVGDTVVWINIDEFSSHTTSSELQFPDPDAWHAVLIGFEDTFAKTFNKVGTFTYKDELDTSTGTIIVESVNEPPELILASPRIIGGRILFEATGLTVGKESVLEFSTNLVHWTAVGTNLADSTAITFTNELNPGARFFRVHQLP